MIELTHPDGSPVWIAKSWVQAVRAALPGEYYQVGVVGAVIVMSGFNQIVQEDVATAVNTIWNAHG